MIIPLLPPPLPAHTHLQPPSPTRDSRDGDRLSFMGAVVHLHHLIVCLCHVFTVLEHFFFVFKWRKRVEMIMLMFDPAWCWWHFSFCVCSVVASVFVSQPAVKKTVSPFLPYLPSTRFIRTRDFFYLKKKKKTFKKVRKVKKKRNELLPLFLDAVDWKNERNKLMAVDYYYFLSAWIVSNGRRRFQFRSRRYRQHTHTLEASNLKRRTDATTRWEK